MDFILRNWRRYDKDDRTGNKTKRLWNLFHFKRAPNAVFRSSSIISFAYIRNVNVINICDGDLHWRTSICFFEKSLVFFQVSASRGFLWDGLLTELKSKEIELILQSFVFLLFTDTMLLLDQMQSCVWKAITLLRHPGQHSSLQKTTLLITKYIGLTSKSSKTDQSSSAMKNQTV